MSRSKNRKVKDEKAAGGQNIPSIGTQHEAIPDSPPAFDGVLPEIVAVIAAAVTAYYGGTPVQAQIQRIRQSTGRPAWAFAGLLESTRPF